MPQKFTFPTIDQAMSLQSAADMEEIKVNLRQWFKQTNRLNLSENVAWTFKLINSELLQRRYVHCKFCQAKLIYVKNSNIDKKNNKLNSFKLIRFNLHHNHSDIESVKQKGKKKTFPHIYPKVFINPFSVQKQKKMRTQKLRKKRQEINKYKKLQLYYRLNLVVQQNDKKLINIKQFAAKTLGISPQSFANFLNSNNRGIMQIAAIKQLLKKIEFEKYNVELDNTTKTVFNRSYDIESDQEDGVNQQEQNKEENRKIKKISNNITMEKSIEFFKELMIFVNYREYSKKCLEESQGFINITLIEKGILSKKFQSNFKWNALLLYSHDLNFSSNQLYAIIMIDSSQFNIRQIKKSFQITFKLLNPLKKIHIKCCIHQQNIYIMGALDLIIEDMLSKQQQTQQLNLSYFLSPKLSINIIQKCQFIPKIFRPKLIDKIFEFNGKQVDAEFNKIIIQLQKASKIKQFKTKTQQYLTELKQFYENAHKIFLGKLVRPNFISLMFTKNHKEEFCISMHERLEKQLQKYSSGQKYFFQFLIMILEIFQIPGGSFIYKRHEGQTREPTNLQIHYGNCLTMYQPKYFDEIKQFYNRKAFKGQYYKLNQNQSNADFYDQFCALLYQKTFRLKQIYMKLDHDVMAILIRQIQKSFTLQIQTRTIQQVKTDGFIKVKEPLKAPNTVKILNNSKFWPNQKLKQTDFEIIEKNISGGKITSDKIIELDQQETNIQKNQNNISQKGEKMSRKLWQCDCNLSKFTYLPCSHQIRCCFTFFNSIQDQIHEFWLFDPNSLQNLQEDSEKSDIQSQQEESNKESREKQRQQNSQSD